MKIKLLLSLLALLLCVGMAFADEYKVEVDGVKYTIDTREEYNYAYVTGAVDQNVESIEIAESVTYDGVVYPVRLVGRSAFSYSKSLKSVKFPEALQYIDGYAFMNTSLTEVTIPANVEYLGNSVFSGCQELEKVTLNGGGQFENFVFANCPKLTEITLPVNASEVSALFVRGSKNLTTINVPENCPNYSSHNGMLCSKDGKELIACPWGKGAEPEIPEGVTAIGKSCFDSYPLQWIEFPESVEVIGERAFASCTALDELVLGKNVREIGQQAFQLCSQLTSVTFNDKLQSIGIQAFSSCSKIKALEIPDNVTSISSMAFDYCSGITSIKVGAGVTELSSGVFSGCSALTDIQFSEGLKIVGESSLSMCRSLSTLTFPESVEKIEESAFWGCYGLKELHFGSNLKSIAATAFLNVEDFTDIYITAPEPPAVEQNTFYVFKATIHVPKASLNLYKENAIWGKFAKIVQIEPIEQTKFDVEENGIKYVIDTDETVKSAFVVGPVSAADIEKAEIVASLVHEEVAYPVVRIQADAFKGCAKLTSATLPESLIAIEDGAFEATGLSEIVLPVAIESVGPLAFTDSQNLSAINIAEGSELYSSVDGVLFTADGKELLIYPCGKGNAPVVAEGVTAIGELAFYRTPIVSVELPASLESIGEEAFAGTAGLEKIYSLATTPPEAQENTFDSYEATVYVPEDCLSRYRDDIIWRNFTNIVEVKEDAVQSIEAEAAAVRKIYSLDGISVGTVVGTPADAISGLPSGVYIITDGTNSLKIAK